ncbi:MAG TPA: NAD(+) kinase [Firmicutes bacterium]|nr:NAD(+) kinase [Bacillota bacterium]
MRVVGVVFNPNKSEALEVCDWLLASLQKKGIRVIVPEQYAAAIQRPDLAVNDAEFRISINAAISLGGDGTLLGLAHFLAGAEKPILGVNLGQLGFLTDVELNALSQGIDRLLTGQYKVEKRTMLEAIVVRHGEEIKKFIALNDVVIAKGAIARLIRLRTYVDDQFVTMYPADGLIVSTATGSTGYCLSAGGPLIHPTLPVTVIMPICPHTLNARALVISDHQQVKISVQAGHSETLLTTDGQRGINLQTKDLIIVRKAPFVTPLIKVSGRDYFEVLRTKMHSGGNADG